MPDRTRQPEIHAVRDIQLPQPKEHRLDNGIRVIENRMGTQDVLKLEVIFKAGRPFELLPLSGRATASMLKEGSDHFTSAQIAETIDFYGGTLTTPFHMDLSNLTVYCLSRHFEALLPMLTDILTKPVFPQKELQSFVDRSVRRLQVDLSRNDIIAYRTITEEIFGVDHPYGYNSSPATYLGLNREMLETHFNRCYNAANCTILISGMTNVRTINLLNTYLGKAIPAGDPLTPRLMEVDNTPRKIQIDHPDKVQTAIRIGRRMFSRHHPDYPGMYVLNTILGGYFGSRLMANIREEKGYTYNIYSALDPMIHDGYFYIGTEVGKEFTTAAVEEIYKEMDILRKELIEEEELEMVRNYLLGNLLTMIDGPFNVADVIRTIETDGLPADFFQQLTQAVSTVSAEELRELARKYLKEGDLWEVVVG